MIDTITNNEITLWLSTYLANILLIGERNKYMYVWSGVVFSLLVTDQTTPV